MNNYIPYTKQTIYPEDIDQVKEVLSRPIITRGPVVEAFEKSVALYTGAKYAVSFNSGTSALYAACFAGKVGPNDHCLTSPNSFIASTGCAAFNGATPVFLDIDRQTGNIDLKNMAFNLEKKRTRGQTVIIPVHFSGIPVEMEKIERMIQSPETLVIEDAAHAIGSCYADGSKVGSCKYSDLTIFSFHPAKQITTGEGGMVLTNQEELYKRLKLYRNNGIVKEGSSLKQEESPWYYEVLNLTGNFHLPDFSSALGLSQFKRIDQIVQNRQKLVKAYKELLKNIPHVQLFTSKFDHQVSFHLMVVQIDFKAYKTDRKSVMLKLHEKGIGTQYHYIPIYRHPVFSRLSDEISDYFPEMESYFQEALSLPLYTDLKLDQVEFVVNSLKEVLQSSQ